MKESSAKIAEDLSKLSYEVLLDKLLEMSPAKTRNIRNPERVKRQVAQALRVFNNRKLGGLKLELLKRRFGLDGKAPASESELREILRNAATKTQSASLANITSKRDAGDAAALQDLEAQALRDLREPRIRRQTQWSFAQPHLPFNLHSNASRSV